MRASSRHNHIYEALSFIYIGKLQRNLELELKFKPSMLMGGGGGGGGGAGGGEGDDLRRNQTMPMPHTGSARKAAPGGGATPCKSDRRAYSRESRSVRPPATLPCSHLVRVRVRVRGDRVRVRVQPPCHAAPGQKLWAASIHPRL